MRRVIAITAAGISLAGCSSFSTDSWKFDYFKSTPPTVQLQLESTPPGADARLSIGPGCKTPCSVNVTSPEGDFTVTYAMAGLQPATVPVRVIKTEGTLFSSGTVKVDPNPVVAELRPAAPPPKPMRPKRKKPAAAPADGTASDAGQAAAPPAR